MQYQSRQSPSDRGDKVLTFVPLDDHIRHTISQCGCGTSITQFHPSSQFDVGLFTCIVHFRQSLRDHELRHIDFVLQEVGNNLFRVAASAEMSEEAQRGRRTGRWNGLRLGSFHVPIDQHFVQARLNNGGDQPTIVPSNSLPEANFQRRPTPNPLSTYLDPLRIHLIVFLRPCPI